MTFLQNILDCKPHRKSRHLLLQFSLRPSRNRFKRFQSRVFEYRLRNRRHDVPSGDCLPTIFNHSYAGKQLKKRETIRELMIEFQGCGIPIHYGFFYAMGVALIIEGILSACYHICPSQSNYQFGKYCVISCVCAQWRA